MLPTIPSELLVKMARILRSFVWRRLTMLRMFELFSACVFSFIVSTSMSTTWLRREVSVILFDVTLENDRGRGILRALIGSRPQTLRSVQSVMRIAVMYFEHKPLEKIYQLIDELSDLRWDVIGRRAQKFRQTSEISHKVFLE